MTLVVVVVMVWLGFQDTCESWLLSQSCSSKFRYLLEARPNEVGDTLAGFAGALAFVWLIATVWLQSHELKEQRRELVATREELSLARSAQEKQVAALEAQAEIFRDEKRARDEMRQSSILDELLVSLARDCELGTGLSYWDLKKSDDDFAGLVDDDGSLLEQGPVDRLYLFERNPPKDMGASERIHAHGRAVFAATLFFSQYNGVMPEIVSFPSRDFVSAIADRIKIIEDENFEGEYLKVRLLSLNLNTIRGQLMQLLELDIWRPERDEEL